MSNEVKNALFLHCLFDSPNHNFDPTRIFYDYIDWILRSLEIISRGDQSWIVRSHPHSVLLGEDTYQLLCSYPLMRKALMADNIIFQNGHLTRLDLKYLQKIVTYSGTVAEEAVLCLRRPITIAHSFVSQLFPDLCHRPQSISQYETLLLSKCDSSFRLHLDSIHAFEAYLQKISDITPPELHFSVDNGFRQYSGELDQKEINRYLDLMYFLQNV